MKPYWANGRATLYQGHVLDALAAMEAGSVHLAVTSPPYWSLRDYQTEPVEWPAVSYALMAGLPEIEIPGCVEGCEHVWGPKIVAVSQGGQSDFSSSTLKRDGRPEDSRVRTLTENAKELDRKAPTGGQYCQLCGGWRGSLGLEPSVDMFVGHLVLIFRALHRVLRDDGTLWLNLGDSFFSSSAKGGSGTPTGRNGRGENYARQARGEASDRRYRLRSDLTPEQRAYVLSELVKADTTREATQEGRE